MKEYVVKAKMTKEDETTTTYVIKAYNMKTRYGCGAAFFDDNMIMIAYFPIVFSVQAREAT